MKKKDLVERLKDCGQRTRSHGGFWCKSRSDCAYQARNVVLTDDDFEYCSCNYFDHTMKKRYRKA